MRQHGTGDRVADGVDARHIGGVAGIDDHASLVVGLHAGFFEPETLGEGHATDRHQHDIGIDCFRRTAGGRLDRGLELVSRDLDAGDLGRKLECDPLLFKQALELAADLAVQSGQDAVEELDHDDLGAQAAPHRAEFEPDHAGPDHQEPLRHLVQHERTGRGDDTLFVDLDAAQARDIRAGGDHDRLAFDRLAGAVGGFHLDLAGSGDATETREGLDLVLLEQEGNTLDVAVDAFVLEFHHGGEIELRLTKLDAHLAEQVAGFFEQLGGVQQRLRGNAADIEASAAEGLFLFHDSHFHAELRRADGADIPAGTGADHDEVVGHASLRTTGRHRKS